MFMTGNGFLGYENWIYGSRMKSKNLNSMKNNRAYTNTRILLCNLAINTFEWEGLPESVNEKFLEWSLLTTGSCAIGEDENYGLIGLPFSNLDRLNIYGESPLIKMYGGNGYNKEYNSYIRGSDNEYANAVRCYDNLLGYPYISYINEASERISETMRSIDAATKKLKNPYFFIGDKSRQKEFQQLMKDLSDNHDAIMLTDGMSLETILKVENITYDVSIVTALWEQYQRYESNVKEILGITNNENIDKDERLLVDEINANNKSTDMNLDLRLRSRQEFCKDLNDLFGLNVSVKIRHQEMIKEFGLNEDESNEKDKQDEGGDIDE